MTNFRFSILFFFALIPALGIAQSFEKIIFNSTDDQNGYYLALRPRSGNIRGVLVLGGGIMDSPEDIFPESKLPNVCYANDILTICIPFKQMMSAEENSIKHLNIIFEHVKNKFSVDPDQFAFGGFFTGGTILIRYAELCLENQSKFPIKPVAVFGVEAPLDLIRLREGYERDIVKNVSEGTVLEAKYMTKFMDEKLGPASSSLYLYKEASPFVLSDRSVTHEKSLSSSYLRLYYDNDISWQLQNRKRSYNDLSIPVASELISTLLQSGNRNAELISGKTGYRSSGLRNPRSWSVVDEVDCVEWLKKAFQFFPQYAPQNYTLVTPKDWETEKIRFPLPFAPSISYKGFADLRFSPEWGIKNAQGMWSYTILWSLKSNPVVSVDQLQKDLKVYYSGLNEGMAKASQIDVKKVTPTSVELKELKPESGDTKTFSGKIKTFDSFATLEEITLNIKCHVRSCKDDLVIFFEISPKDHAHKIWHDLDSIYKSFDCLK